MADNVNSSIMQHQTGTAFVNGKCLNKEKQRTEMPPHKIGFTIQSTNCIPLEILSEDDECSM